MNEPKDRHGLGVLRAICLLVGWLLVAAAGVGGLLALLLPVFDRRASEETFSWLPTVAGLFVVSLLLLAAAGCLRLLLDIEAELLRRDSTERSEPTESE